MLNGPARMPELPQAAPLRRRYPSELPLHISEEDPAMNPRNPMFWLLALAALFVLRPILLFLKITFANS